MCGRWHEHGHLAVVKLLLPGGVAHELGMSRRSVWMPGNTCSGRNEVKDLARCCRFEPAAFDERTVSENSELSAVSEVEDSKLPTQCLRTLEVGAEVLALIGCARKQSVRF